MQECGAAAAEDGELHHGRHRDGVRGGAAPRGGGAPGERPLQLLHPGRVCIAGHVACGRATQLRNTAEDPES